jgi:hypothetical protein
MMKKASPTASATSEAELTLYSSIRSLVLSARNTVARGVDLVQVRTNFEIGRHIVEYEQQGEARAAYGKELLASLAERLTAEFGKGFGRSNIAYARSFYLAYQARRPIVQTASGQLRSGALHSDRARSHETPTRCVAGVDEGIPAAALIWRMTTH